MSLDNLRKSVAASGSDVVLAYGDAMPELYRLARCWWDVLDTYQIEIHGAAVTGAVGSGPLTITGATTLLGMPGIVTVSFFLTADASDDEDVDCLIEWASPVDTWRPGDAYLDPPSVEVIDTPAQILVRALELTGAHLLFSSIDIAGGAATVAECPLPSWLSGRLPAYGLTVLGDLLLPDDVELLLASVLPKRGPLSVQATVTAWNNFLVIDLAHDFGQGTPGFAPLGAKGPKATPRRLRLAFPIDDWATTPAIAELEAVIAGSGWQIDVTLTIDAVNRTATIDAIGTPGPSLEWLVSTMEPPNYQALPTDILEPLGELALNRLQGTFDLASGALTDYLIAIDTVHPLVLFDGFPPLQAMLVVEVTNQPSPATQLGLSGQWQLGSGTLDTYIDPIARTVSARLAVGSSFDHSGLGSDVFPDHLTRDMELIGIDIEGDWAAKSFSAEIDTDGMIALSIEGNSLAIEDVSLTLQYANGAFSGTATGTLDILGFSGGVELVIDDGFQLSFALPEVNLSELAELFLKAIGEPADLGSFALRDISITLDQARGQFSIAAALADPIAIAGSSWAIDSAAFYASRDDTGIQANLAGQVTLAGIDIELTAEYSMDGGWSFAGTGASAAPIGIDALAADLLKALNIHLPSALATGITLTDLSLAFTTKSPSLHLGVTGHLHVHGTALAVALTFDLAGGQCAASGTITMGEAGRQQVFTLSGTENGISASWSGRVAFSELARNLGLDLGSSHPPSDLDPALTSASFSWDHKMLSLSVAADGFGSGLIASVMDGDTRAHVFVLSVASGVNLSNLPVARTAMGADKSLYVEHICLVATSAVSAATAAAVNPVLQAQQLPPLPDGGGAAGIALTVLAQLAGTERSFALPVPSAQAPAPGGVAPGAAAAPAVAVLGTAPAVATPTPAAGLEKWFDIDRAFGPVAVQRLGVRYRDKVLSFLLDASLAIPALQLDLVGLAVGSPITKFAPTVSLEGLGVDYTSAGIAISAGLDHDPATGQYAGFASITLGETMSLRAVGAYGRGADDETELFIFAYDRQQLGGPPCLTITGIAAGFGINRAFRVPSIDHVGDFPFIQIAQGQDPAAGAPGAALEPNQLFALLAGIKNYLPPSPGSDFATIGFTATSFGFINSVVLATVEFGTTPVIVLLGNSVLDVPKAAPIAHAELDLVATMIPSEGTVIAAGGFGSGSYVLSSDCVLTGEYAFSMWSSGAHAGDFVISMGGYSPHYVPPAHYPVVSRLGFVWRVSDRTMITGWNYFALTPSAVMAGGGLDVVFQDGPINAWCHAEAHFLIEWKPFHYDAEIYVDLGASIRIDLLFFSTTLSVDVSCDLAIWGPEFSGHAYVSLSVISFGIDFGAGASRDALPPPSWTEFLAAFMPARPSGGAPSSIAPVTDVVVTRGLGGSVAAGANAQAGAGDAVWVIDPDLAEITVATAFPATQARLNGVALALGRELAIGVRPMAIPTITTTLNVAVTYHEGAAGAGFPSNDLGGEAIIGAVPTALWGGPGADTGAATRPAVTGIRLRGKPSRPDRSPTVVVETLGYEDIGKLPPHWEQPGLPAAAAGRLALVPEIARRGIVVPPGVAVSGAGWPGFMAPPQSFRLGA